MTDQPPPEKPPQSILPYAPPPGAIIISEAQFEELEERAQRKPINIMPYAILALFLVLVAVVGSMALGIYLTRPTPIVWPTPIPTQIVIIPTTVRPTDTPTATPTLTPTPDLTQTVEANPAMAVIIRYFERLSMADYGAAWKILTEKCRDNICWDNFHSDYKLFIETMRRYGPINIQEIRPELVYNNTASAFVILWFRKEMQLHSYRFFLVYDGEEWRINSIEFVSLVK